MDLDQEATWHALLELAEARPRDWCLIGGQMVALHAYEAGREPPRLTTDGDLVIDIRAAQDALKSITGVLLARGFTEDGISPEEVGHRYVRGRAVLDVLLPEGVGERRRRVTATGARTIQAAGTTQALERAELTGVQLPDGVVGRVARPTLPGAIVAKCAAAEADTGPRGNGRHLTDIAFLASLISSLRTMRSQTTPKDRQRLRRAAKSLDGHPAWLGQPDPLRAQRALDLLAQPLPG
jgi:predicted nucleotidyltransferase